MPVAQTVIMYGYVAGVSVWKCVCACARVWTIPPFGRDLVFPPESVCFSVLDCIRCGEAIENLPTNSIDRSVCRECQRASLELQYRELSRYVSSRLGFKDRQPHILASIVDFYQHRLL